MARVKLREHSARFESLHVAMARIKVRSFITARRVVVVEAKSRTVRIVCPTWYMGKASGLLAASESNRLKENHVIVVDFPNIVMQILVHWLQIKPVRPAVDKNPGARPDIACEWLVYQIVADYVFVVLELLGYGSPESTESVLDTVMVAVEGLVGM